MTKHITTISLALIAFVFVTEALVVPPVRAGTNPTRFEYKWVKESSDASEAEKVSNQMGAQGWELVAVERPIYHFKRPLP
jgi:hypothetical protein